MELEAYLIKLCKHVGLLGEQFSIEIDSGEKLIKAKLVLPTDEEELFVGRRGQTIQSLQRLVRVSFYDQLEGKIFKLNVNNYRQQREEELKERVATVADRVRETEKDYTFSFLTAHDRYLIHSTLSEDEKYEDLTSESSGQGRHRYLTIKLSK